MRNHRKVVVVDGNEAILGGMNLSGDYLGPEVDDSRWIDLALHVRGPVVSQVEDIFAADWKFAAGESLPRPGFALAPESEPMPEALQTVASGPDAPTDPLYDSIVSAIFAATRRVWIATPYFIPDETLSKALELAARRGIDVRLLLPERSNHLLADLCRGSYLRQLEKSGGKIAFCPRMMHAKVVIVDEVFAIVGSANLDMRSLLINYEVGLFAYSKSTIAAVTAWFSALSAHAIVKPMRKTLGIDLVEGLGRILGPVL